MTATEVNANASTQRSFNAINFGEYQARGREAAGATYFNGSLFGVFDLFSHIQIEGRRCIDIGCGGMLKLGVFEILAERTLTDYSEFVAFLARGESDPNLVSQRASNTLTIHERLMSNPSSNFSGYSFADFVRARDGKSSIKVSPLEARRQIKEDSFDCRFPLNPRKLINPIGAKYR